MRKLATQSGIVYLTKGRAMPMKTFLYLMLTIALTLHATAQTIKRDIPYAGTTDPHQNLDVYAPADAKDLPVIFWIHGGGWEAGDKADVKLKPQATMEQGFIFVSINYRLLPSVDMATLVGDVAKAFGWVHTHIAEYGGDPKRVLVAGHSAGAQLAALICTDERYLKSQGVSFDVLIGCIPVDGDTYDLPAIIETEDTLWRTHHLPPLKFGHREKFGNDPDKFRDFSAVYHVEKGKGIPPFLLLYITANPTTTAQAQHFANVLKDAGVSATLFGAKDATHNQLNDRLGDPNDPATQAVHDFVASLANK
jgi:acetyl esterase/lipase